MPGLFQGNKDHPAIFYTLFPSDIPRLLTRRLALKVVLKFHQVPYHAQFIFPRNCKNVIGLDNMGWGERIKATARQFKFVIFQRAKLEQNKYLGWLAPLPESQESRGP